MSVIAVGGVTDHRRREIPNIVPVTLILSGLFLPNLSVRFASLLVMILVILLAKVLTGRELPGGDLKLICAMTFFLGMVGTLLILLAVAVEAAAVSLIRRRPARREIPLCTYVAPAFILLVAANLIIGG